MFDSLSLKYKMILGGVAAVFIPFYAAGLIIYVQLTDTLLDTSQKRAIHLAQDVARLIDIHITQEIKLATSIASDPVVIESSKSGDYRAAQNKLDAIYKGIGNRYFTIYLADKKGIARADAVFSQQIGLDLSDRKYFQKAKQGRASLGGPMLPKGDATPGSPIIMLCTPIMENGEFLGIVGIPFNTDFIVKITSRVETGQTGKAFLVNSEGLVLIHPDKSFILKRRIPDHPGAEEFGKLIRAGKTGTASYRMDGNEKIAGLTRMATSDWLVVFSQTRDEIMAPVNRILSTILICGIVFLVITIALIVYFSREISTPVQRLLEMMTLVTRHSKEIFLHIGLDRKIVYANPAYETLIGKKTEDILDHEPDFTTPGNISSDEIWGSIEVGNPWSGRFVFHSGSDNPAIMDIMLVPLRDSKGAITGYFEIGRNITKELMYEKRFQQGQKLEAIGTLAGGIAHDFNNILSGIFGYAELALMDKNHASATDTYVREIVKASERARDLVSQILTFSRQTKVELKPLLPKLVLKEALKLLRASIPATIDLQVELNSDSAIQADPTQIYQVVMNLFMNAAHAIGEDAGAITLELEDFFVDVEFKKMHPGVNEGNHIKMSVSDTGCGMKPHLLDRIFEPFFTTKPRGKGTGLGLAVVHGIVKELNGIITAYSEAGKGTVFNIVIPCVETDEALQATHEPLIRGKGEKIAFVDDEIAILKTIQALLENLGYNVTAFSNSDEAFTAISETPEAFDLLISDYSMPKITGLKMAEKLKSSNIRIPVILASGFFSKEVEESARELGINELISKPLNTYQLTVSIRNILSAGPSV